MPDGPPPFLVLLSATPTAWTLAAGVLRPTDAPPRVHGSMVRGAPLPMAAEGGETLYRIDLGLRLGQGGAYTVDGETYEVRAPERGAALRLAYVSCDGAERPEKYPAHDWAALWHEVEGCRPDVLLHGGDQVYADGVETCHPDVARIFLTGAEPRGALTRSARIALWRHYWGVYRRFLDKTREFPLLSTVPSVTMWDDHDAYDGFGSHPEAVERTMPMREMRAIAKRAFHAFQRLEAPRADASLALDLGGVGLVAPDLRSNRTPDRVLRDEDRGRLERGLAVLGHCRRLFCMSSVPLVGMESGWIERLVRGMGLEPRFVDDLRDQFSSPVHRREREVLLGLLADHTRRTGKPVDILSGEIHMAGHATAEANDVTLHQLISSGIGHPPPSAAYALGASLGGWVPRRRGGLRLRLRRLPGRRPGFVPVRNWLELTVAVDGGCTATWHFETGGVAEMAL
jgi:hypothetical protein